MSRLNSECGGEQLSDGVTPQAYQTSFPRESPHKNITKEAGQQTSQCEGDEEEQHNNRSQKETPNVITVSHEPGEASVVSKDNKGEPSAIDGAEENVRKASLAIRAEDALKGLEQLAIQVIRYYKTAGTNTFEDIAHELDNCHTDLELWLYDVSMTVPLLTESREALESQGRDMDLSAYDVLEILEGHSNSVCEEISRELYWLEQSLASLRDYFAKTNSINKPGNHDLIQCEVRNLPASIGGLNKLKSRMRREVAAIVDKPSGGNEKTRTFLKPRRPSILSFDGGGVRSLSSLLILEELMKRVVKHSNETEEALLPRDIFDYMFGASSGGLVAIMLGRLKMTVPVSIEKFERHTRKVFHRRTWRFMASAGLFGPKYAADRISRSAWSIVKEVVDDGAERDERWKLNTFAAPTDHCKTAVLVKASHMLGTSFESDPNSESENSSGKARQHAGVSPARDSIPSPKGPSATVRGEALGQRAYFLRSYNHPQPRHDKDGEENQISLSISSSPPLVSDTKQDSEDVDAGAAATCEIWQAARATSAAPYYFPTMRIDDLMMHDSGSGLNNPSVQALLCEVLAVEGSTDSSVRKGVFVSIGTGGSWPGTSGFGEAPLLPPKLARSSSFGFTTKIGDMRGQSVGASVQMGRNVVSVARNFVHAATDTGPVHKQMSVLAPQLGFRYFRFDVPWIGDVALDDWKALKSIRERTEKYLEEDQVKAELERCAKNLVQNRRARR